MRRVMFLAMILGMMAVDSAFANPLPCFEISFVNLKPPQIGLNVCDSIELSGDTIFTSAGIAIIDSGVIAAPFYQEPFIFDSTNTSGFVLNPEADSIYIYITRVEWNWLEKVGWGTWGRHSVPLDGYSTILKDYWHIEPPFGSHVRILCFDFSTPRQGYEPVIINEISAHSTWAEYSGFIEFYNTSSEEIDLSDWMIVCDTIYRIPQGARVAPHGVWAADQIDFPPAFDMDYTGDNIYLVNSDSEIVDQVGWSSDHGENVSFMRFPDGNADTLWQAGYWGYNDQSSDDFSNGFPTRRAFNRTQSPGLKVIGARADTAGGLVNIRWSNPIWVADFDYVVVRKCTAEYPPSPTDGQLVYTGTAQEFLGDQVPPGQATYYTVFARTVDGTYSVPDSEAQAGVYLPQVGVEEDEPLPESPLLLSCYPNPFNAQVTIEHSAGELAIYNLAGQRVAVFADMESGAGTRRVMWDASGVPSGVYFAKLTAGGGSRSVKLTLVK